MDAKLLKPAVTCGVVVGVLSALPLFRLANICCFLWAWVAVFLAVKSYASSSGCGAGKGILIGLIAGIVAGIVWPFCFAGVNLAMGMPGAERFMATARKMDFDEMLSKVEPEQREAVKKYMENFVKMTPRQALFAFTKLMAPVNAVVATMVCMMAGLVGALVFGSAEPAASAGNASQGGDRNGAGGTSASASSAAPTASNGGTGDTSCPG